jgi:hypothetical protein
MSYTIKYKRVRVKVEGDKPTICECCLKKPNIIQCHHWVYRYSKKEVLENPNLTLKNTNFLCYFCHRIANSLRVEFENNERATILLRLRRESLSRGK